MMDMNISFTRVQFMLFMFVAQTGSVFILFQRPFIVAAGSDAWLFFIVISLFHLGVLLFFERYYPSFQLTKTRSVIYALYWIFVVVTSISSVAYLQLAFVVPEKL